MAVKKSASPTKAKAQDAPVPKTKAVGAKNASAAKKETAPQTTTAAPKTKAAAPKVSAEKPAAPKKAPAAPAKLTSTQTELLTRVHGAGEPGYLSAKKGEQRTLDALRERKLIKRGAKHKETGEYHYQVSTAGKKHVGSNPPATPAATTTTPTAGSTAPAASGGTA